MRPGLLLLVRQRRWLLVLPFAALLVLFVLPLLAVLPQAVGYPQITGEAFTRALTESVYVQILRNTVVTSLIVTGATLVIAYPLAWTMSQCGPRLRAALALLTLVPFLTSALVVTFSWIAILGVNGLLNDVLVGLGVVRTPTSFLFTRFAVVLALIQTSIPLMVLPLFATMQKIDPRIVRVAESLGATRLAALRRTVIPLSLPGIQIGVIFVFLYNMAAFIAPAVLGAPSDAMVGQLIESEIESGLDWGFAAALAILLVGISVIMVALIAVLFRRLAPWQHEGDRRHAVRSTGQSESLPLGDAIVPTQKRSSWLDVVSRPGILRVASVTYLTLVAAYILGPLAVIIPVSFTSTSALVFPPPGWSTQWYERATSDGMWIGPAVTSIEIAAGVTVLACTLALAATLGFGRTRARGQTVAEPALTTPMMVPTVVYALGAYLVFARLHLVDSILGIALAQAILVMPVAYLIISAAYRAVEVRLEQAAVSLGAGPFMTLWRVVLPLMRPGLLAAGLLCALLSFDEAVVSVFLSGVNVETLPRRMWEGIRFNTSPEIAAVSTILILVSVAVVIVSFAVFGRLAGRRNLVDVLARSDQQ